MSRILLRGALAGIAAIAAIAIGDAVTGRGCMFGLRTGMIGVIVPTAKAEGLQMQDRSAYGC